MQELKKILLDKEAILDFALEQLDVNMIRINYNVISIPPAPPAPHVEVSQQEAKADTHATTAASSADTAGSGSTKR